MPTSGQPSTTQRSFTGCARTTGQASESTVTTTRPTGRPGERSHARLCCWSPLTTTWTSTATQPPSGPLAAGPLRHRTIDCGHHQAEEAPGPVAEEMLDFLESK